ncbi:defensin-like protein [Corchorus capsularis]|uniref:Defensin-like protein n=1 Tax=Corchorus capsularis TaxID=210143 RepID=A0A1R3GVG6_COCAP|nr:defensin-like protein [Corchorus capsularis]
MKSLSISAILLLFLFLSFGNQLIRGQEDDDCQPTLPDPGCTQENCNSLCIERFGKTGKFGQPTYGVCYMGNTCICRPC